MIHGMALCSGIGGLELGLGLIMPTFRTICFVEGEAYPVSCLVKRMEEGHLHKAPIWSDVRTFDPSPWRGRVDIITAGYPCQPFSVAGKRNGEADPRHLWPSIVRVVSNVQPAVCFFENVPNHLNVGFKTVVGDLEAMDYTVAAGIFAAEEVGSPHLRKRLFIVAYRHGGGWETEWLSTTYLEGSSGPYTHRRGEPLAHPEPTIRKPQQRGEGAAQTSQCGVTELGYDGPSFPLWPPGPTADWSKIDPSLEPSLRRVADGVPYRVDRLRALGNAVVPSVAAHAFERLIWDAAHHGREVRNE